MKKNGLKILLVSLAMGVFYFGFGSFSFAEKPYAGTTITWIYQEHTTTPFFLEKLPEFERETGIKVKVEIYPYGKLMDKQRTMYALGSSDYDVGQVKCFSIVEWIENGWIEPLDKYIKNSKITRNDWLALDDFFPNVLKLYNIDGKQWGIPAYTETQVLYYRRDLFAKYGIKVPETLLDLELAAAKFYESTGIPAIALRARREGYNAPVVWSHFLHSFGGDYFNYETMEPTVNTPMAITATVVYARLLRNYGLEGPAALNWDDVRDLMFAGKVGMILDCSGWAARFEGPGSVVAGKLGYTTPPTGPVNQVTGYSGMAFFIPVYSKKKEAAWQLIQWLSSPENRIYAAIRGSSYIDRRSTLEDPKVREIQGAYPGFLEALYKGLSRITFGYRPVVPNNRAVEDAVGLAVNRVIAGELSAKEALNQANEEIRKIMESGK